MGIDTTQTVWVVRGDPDAECVIPPRVFFKISDAADYINSFRNDVVTVTEPDELDEYMVIIEQYGKEIVVGAVYIDEMELYQG